MPKSHAELGPAGNLPGNDVPRAVRANGRNTSARASKDRRACPLCGSTAEYYFGLPHTSVRQCSARTCRLQFADPQLDDRSLRQAYENLYYPAEGNGQPIQCENTSEDILRQVFSQLEQRVGALRGLRLLDYGCGVGALLRVASEFAVRPTGIETDAQARATAATTTGLPVYQNLEQLSANEPDIRFEVIVLWTVIEHLRRPWEDLARLRRFLAPDGWLLLSTMNVRCLRARIQRYRWDQYRNPTHLYYFDPRSLARVIQRSGFLEFSHWPLRIEYPHHGALRRSLHYAGVATGFADGIYYLCRNSSLQGLQSRGGR
jgi:2-polyprenyl-3-methyl-5-hydroxy-6-metoxy-1,4-benzoquinol methylase